MRVDVTVRSDVRSSPRLQQISAMFDAPLHDVSELSWSGDLPVEERDWSVGMIVGPSGSGKTTVARQAFGLTPPPEWDDSVPTIENFGAPLDDVVLACQSVGFNTVPAWMRPHSVLSNGERFRADMARLMLETDPGRPIVVDEFTSVVDRQVAKITAHAVQKWARKKKRQFVAVSCHYDIEDWLQPDWVLEPATMSFRWRLVQPRPPIDVVVSPAPRSAWELFAPFHYLTRNVHHLAKAFVAYVDGQPTSVIMVMQQPGKLNIKSVARGVTLPDWQGLGLVFVLIDAVGAACRTKGWYLHIHPAHPSLVRSIDRSPNWSLRSRGGLSARSKEQALRDRAYASRDANRQSGIRSLKATEGTRASATFRYCGPAMGVEDADRLLVPHLLRA